MANVIPIAIFVILFAIPFPPSAAISSENRAHLGHSSDGSGNSKKREMIEVEGGPDDLVWVVQLSDLHFSVHHPERARDFREIVGPTLSFIKPSLVLLTGDLTGGFSVTVTSLDIICCCCHFFFFLFGLIWEWMGCAMVSFGLMVSHYGKSKDLLTMKQDEEWIEYEQVMQDVVRRSGLDKSTFYDVRGNHDNFGVPAIGGPFDFFSKYSINEQLQRSGKVNSITIQTSKRKLLFVGFDSTMSSGLRGPTNLFGHPTDELLADINSELSQWDSQPSQPITKISFGHFPVSFSAASESGKTLQDIFTTHSVSAYLCGHLHTKFGKNLKRYHHSKQLFQWNGHRTPSDNASNCSNIATRICEFWELEMGDWRKSRAMRILAIDNGHISFVDINFTLGAKKTIILPTFPLDSRFTSASSQNYSSYGVIRALVFSASPILSVLAKIYDSSSGNLIVVFESEMTKLSKSRGDLYVAPWNIQAFEDPSPERYLLQIVATDIMNRSTFTELRPFSINGEKWAYMTYRGWESEVNNSGKIEFLGSPDVMVVVLPHLFFVVLPTVVIIIALAAESGIYRDYCLSRSSKKRDDYDGRNKESASTNDRVNGTSGNILHKRWLRKFFLVVSLAIFWKHFKNCIALMKAYEMNPIVHFQSTALQFLCCWLTLSGKRGKTSMAFRGSRPFSSLEVIVQLLLVNIRFWLRSPFLDILMI
ncbi:hypothetical protein DH2020_030022 [Rehmannia glutinosa]|uniref:Calcineurin-like phosphoesterase domain-containing protein n=1 Tax=Rehmannia glutinosa TaxID=99300 RepID=A0ABR0VNK9_REHGL